MVARSVIISALLGYLTRDDVQAIQLKFIDFEDVGTQAEVELGMGVHLGHSSDEE